MRALSVLGATVLHSLVRQASAHPLCYYEDRPTDPTQVMVFCPEQEEGACCNDLEEMAAINVYKAPFPNGTALTDECAEYYRQVACGPCNSYSAHLYEVLGAELGPEDGMTMKNSFCEELVAACEGEIDFPTYDGESYCEKHTLGSSSDAYWSYPLDPEELTFESTGLVDAFPDLPTSALPSDLICMHMTPDGDEWWLGGQDGQLVKTGDTCLFRDDCDGFLRTHSSFSLTADDSDMIPADGATSSDLVLDISSGADLLVAYEEGLLDFAFNPAFNSNNYFYMSYTIQDNEGTKNRLSRFTYSSTVAATLESIDIILTSEVKATSIHSAGWVGFKPSDYASPSGSSHDIYWAIGDGGPQTDPLGTGQNTSNLLAAMIRVSVPSGTGASNVGYTIPSGNYPGVREEICAPGFRNPFRCGFNSANDDLYCGDVGHTMVEEVDIVECGENYGWNRFEGSRCQEAVEDIYGDCDGASRSGFTFPIYEFCHTDYFSTDPDEEEFTNGVDICGSRGVTGFSVIGGYVYNGQRFSDVLDGAYLFADNQKKNIYYLTQEDGEYIPGVIIGDSSAAVISFAEDNNGEIYVITAQRLPYQLPCGDLCSTTCLDQAAAVPTYTSVGCYADFFGDRALELQTAPSCGEGEEAMSPSICASYCETIEGAYYFGVEFYSECFCGAEGEDFAKHGELDELSCTFLCTGNSDEFCGGKNAIEVYEFETSPTPYIPPSPVPPTPLPPTPLPPIYVDPPVPPSYVPPTPAPETVTSPTPSPFIPVPDTPAPVAPSPDTPAPVVPTPGTPAPVAPTPDTPAPVVPTPDTPAPVVPTPDTPAPVVPTPDTPAPVVPTPDTPVPVVATPDTPVPVVPTPDTPAPVIPTTDTPAPVVSTPDTPVPVVSTPSPANVDFSYLGCFVDSNGARVFSGPSTKSSSMTPELCAAFCEGSQLFGTEFSSECFCSAAGDDYDEFGSATCTFSCAGDSSLTCGGRNAISIFRYDGFTPAPASPTPPAPAAPTATTYIAQGCYTDSSSARLLSGISISTSIMTTELCESFCAGYTYFGTEFGKECFCGSLESLGSDVATNCNMGCSGDPTQTCGGRNAINVYEYMNIATSDYTYLGCYVDSNSNRVMGSKTTSASMTIDLCASNCDSFLFFGTEFGTECFCSNTDDYDALGTSSSCMASCGGDSTEICGGRNAISVYAK